MKFSRSILSSLFVLSLAACIFALVLHGLTYLGIDPRNTIPSTWYWFQLITALAVIPAVVCFGRRDVSHGRPNVPITQTHDRFNKVLGWVVGVSVLYAAFVFLFMGTGHLYNEVSYREAMQRAGYPVTQADVIRYSIRWVRMSSCHWMAVWSFIAAELYAYLVR